MPRTPREPRRPLRAYLADVIDDVHDLWSALSAIALSDTKSAAIRVGIALGLFLVALSAIGFALLFLSLAAWWGLGLLIGNAWSGLIIGVAWILIVAGLIVAGIALLKRLRGFPETSQALREVAAGLRGNAAPEGTTAPSEGGDE